MSVPAPFVLLTGRPGIGKSTIIQKTIALLGGQAGEFFTREILAGGRRSGFEIVTLDGKTGLLATRERERVIRQAVRFGAWRVNLEAVEQVAIPAMLKALAEKQVVVVDEIGPMEIFSEPFCSAVLRLLDDPAVTGFGTIVERPYRFADAVKKNPRISLQAVSLENRDALPEELAQKINPRPDSGLP